MQLNNWRVNGLQGLKSECPGQVNGYPFIHATFTLFDIKSISAFLCLVVGISLLTSCSSGTGNSTILTETILETVAQTGNDDTGSPSDSGDDSVPSGPGTSTVLSEQYGGLEEVRRTWLAAMVRIPDGYGGFIESNVSELESGLVVPDTDTPIVIWLHGCNGFWSGTERRMNWLAANGFAVIAPSSLARDFYPKSCDLATHEAGLYRPTLLMRQFDVDYAIDQASRFDWLDRSNLFLAGFSEGAAVVTTYTGTARTLGKIKARVAESWGCHAGWPEYEGINAPESEPILSLVSDSDPWYTREFHQGDCGEYMSPSNSSLSYIVDYPPLRFQHELLDAPEIREIVLDFLLRQSITREQ